MTLKIFHESSSMEQKSAKKKMVSLKRVLYSVHMHLWSAKDIMINWRQQSKGKYWRNVIYSICSKNDLIKRIYGYMNNTDCSITLFIFCLYKFEFLSIWWFIGKGRTIYLAKVFIVLYFKFGAFVQAHNSSLITHQAKI